LGRCRERVASQRRRNTVRQAEAAVFSAQRGGCQQRYGRCYAERFCDEERDVAEERIDASAKMRGKSAFEESGRAVHASAGVKKGGERESVREGSKETAVAI